MYSILKLILPSYIRRLEDTIKYTNIKAKPKTLISFFSTVIFIVSVALSIYVGFKFNILYAIISFILSFGVLLLFLYAYITLEADRKASSIEIVLPDALQLMASNLRAGLTTDKALFLSAREEFGVLQEEIKKVAKEVSTGRDIKEALSDMNKRVKSDVFERTIGLIVFGLRSGGELTPLLEEAAASLRQQMITQKQMRTNVMMYTIFIFIAIAFVSPLLFALTSVLVETLVTNIASVELPSAAVSSALPIAINAVKIDPQFVLFFSLIMLIATTILGSFVLGLITTGEEKNGLKFMPILLLIAVSLFFIVKISLSGMLKAFV